jgi:outer membrane receptor for Fe3+-dicitrate
MQYRAISGADNTIDNALLVKANNRKYEAKGIQSVGNYSFETGKAKHDIDFGIAIMRIMKIVSNGSMDTQYKTG